MLKVVLRYSALLLILVTVYVCVTILTLPSVLNTASPCSQQRIYHSHEADSYLKLIDPPVRYVSLDSFYALKKSPRDLPLHSELHIISKLKNPCFWAYNCSDQDGSYTSCNESFHCLPYFIVAGTEKSGTSHFHYLLIHHPHIFGPTRKETHFFNDRGIPDSWTFLEHRGTLEGYTKMFDSTIIKANGTAYLRQCLKTDIPTHCPYILGDFTPRYLIYGYHWYEEWFNAGLEQPLFLVPHKIRLLIPKVKIIIMMRNPTKRFFSSYRYFKRINGNKSSEDFHNRAVGQMEAWIQCVNQLQDHRACLYDYPTGMGAFWETNSADQIRVGLYSLYIEEWLTVFPRNQFLFINFDVFKKRPTEYIEQFVLPFLEVESYPVELRQTLLSLDAAQNAKEGRNGDDIEMMDTTQTLLNSFYQPYNDKLAKLLDDDSYFWL